jgi:hypothetical protein
MLASRRKNGTFRLSCRIHSGGRGIALLAVMSILSSTACLPYAVGSSATPVPRGETVRSRSFYYILNAVDVLGDSVSVALPGVDHERRYGISDDADVGVRLTSGAGIVVTAKKRLAGTPAAGGIAIMPGLGLVNLGSHAYGDLTLIASGAERARAMLYGGARVMQVVPVQNGAVHDEATAGGYIGVRIGSAQAGISPELGIYHDVRR